MRKPPPLWGRDELTSFLDHQRANQFATFHLLGGAFNYLIEIDMCIDRIIRDFVNPKPFFPIQFFFRAHSAFRASVALAAAGQLNEAQLLVRNSIEHSAYGLYIGQDFERWTRWMSRGDNEKARKQVRIEFSHEKVSKALYALDHSIGKTYAELYDETIDLGAHPNEPGYSMSTSITEHENDTVFSTLYMHGDGVFLRFTLKRIAQVGTWHIMCLRFQYPSRMGECHIHPLLERISNNYSDFCDKKL